jgi:hypothetical protein
MSETIAPSLSQLADKWPSRFVAQEEVDRFTGGIITQKYLANLDSQGKGPTGRIRVGRKISYPVSNLIEWLESRAEVVVERHRIDPEIRE